jgi:hypothetical protein
VKFWPFVIAVGKYEDYDFVVVPDVISERSRNFWRVSAFRANQATEEILSFDTRIDNRAATCIYRTTYVKDGRSDVVVDSAGRPIFKSVGFLTFDPVDGDKSRWSGAVQAIEAKYREVIDRFVNFRATPTMEWKPACSTLEGAPPSHPYPPRPLLPPTTLRDGLLQRILRFLGKALQNRVVLICLLAASIVFNLFQVAKIGRLERVVTEMSQVAWR